jgi:hypothetical protein
VARNCWAGSLTLVGIGGRGRAAVSVIWQLLTWR